MDDDFDAIVLAGGTAKRLGGVPKHSIVVESKTLLERTLAAVSDAARVVVVGDDLLRPLVGGATLVREDPPLSGPAAGVGAALPHVTAGRVIVLACDQPYVAEAVRSLLDAEGSDGAIAIDAEGRRQNLTFVARTDALRLAVGRHPTLADLAVHRLIEPLSLAEVGVSARALKDVDAWDDLDHG